MRGYVGLYEVSDQGRVRSLDRVEQSGDRRRRRAGRVLRQRVDSFWRNGGYAAVGLYVNGVETSRAVHVLVCEAFHGPQPADKPLVRHLNDQSLDNRAENLAWGTSAENIADAFRNGGRVLAQNCRRGHALRVPNLTRCATGSGERSGCLSCSRARTAVKRRHRLACDGADVQTVSDRYYAEIMTTEGVR